MTNISSDRVKTQLERVLASSEFMAGKRLGQFLSYVVEQALNGQSGGIKQYAVAVEAFGYGADFDPQSNPIVRIEAQRLRRALDHYYYTHGAEDPIRIDVPKGGYVPTFSENHNVSPHPDSSECTAPATAPTSLDASKPSVAVMMISSLNPGDAFGYVATGLTEEIIIALTRFPDFLVVGPLTRDAIHGQAVNIRSIGQQYGVRFVMDGSLRLQGEMFRLTVRLVDAAGGQQLWGEALEFKLQNGSMLAVENDVVSQVAATIADSYGIIPRTLSMESSAQNTETPDAYEAILRFYHYCRVLTPESYVDAVEALEQTLRNQPDHALASAALGDLVASSYWFGYDDDASNLAGAERLARRAVALDPNCQPARYTMALIHFLKFQRSLFLDEAEQALRLNPNNANTLAVVALHLGMVNEWERAVKLMEKAMRLNPHYPGWYHIVAFMNHYRQGEYNRAWIAAKRFNTPEFFWDPLIRAAALGQLDRPKKARKAVHDLLALVPDFKNRGPSLIRRMVYLDEHVDMLVAGLRKAGVEF